jgi:polar amino acid transport system substrate-binding protein
MTFKSFKLILCLWLVHFSALTDELLIGIESIDYAPYSSSEGSEYKGYFRDVLDKFAKDNGHTAVYKALPVKRLMMNYVNGEVDFKIPDNSFWASDLRKGHAISYSKPVTTYIDGVIVSPDRKGAPYEELKTLVTVRGFTPFNFLEDIAKGKLKLNEVDSIKTLIMMVENKRGDGGYMNVSVANYYMENILKTPGVLVYDEQLPKSISEISLSSITKPQVIEQLNSWMAANESWINEMKSKYKVD